MAKIYVTRLIPDAGIEKLKGAGHDVEVNPEDRVLSKSELVGAIRDKGYDAVLCLLTDTIDADVLDAAGPQCKIFANYAVGYNNIDVRAAAERNIMITNTPGVLTESVAEHAFALLLAVARRVVEADKFVRAGKYDGWAPKLFLGNDLSRKTLGIVGLGRIGSRVAYHARHGFEMYVVYYDVNRNEEFEREVGAEFRENLDDLLREADFISVHVPLSPATEHLMNAERFKMMKNSAYLVNTSRGPVIDEAALVEALKSKEIKGAALDVFEDEPALKSGLAECDNVVLTPHIASGTEETRSKMAEMAADNIIAALSGERPSELVEPKP